mmetsp:Transcript_46568/g.92098  ORF Transcript_46568/g.92098 Transcript_46568/m.92098 type:complete len:261 (+) Transcript_46568:24-806(+)
MTRSPWRAAVSWRRSTRRPRPPQPPPMSLTNGLASPSTTATPSSTAEEERLESEVSAALFPPVLIDMKTQQEAPNKQGADPEVESGPIQTPVPGSSDKGCSGGGGDSDSARAAPPAPPAEAPAPSSVTEPVPVLTPEQSPVSTPASGPALKQAVQAPTPAPETAPASSTQQLPRHLRLGHRERLVAFYSKHEPTKLGKVDEFLVKYKGKEEDMWRKLHKKYGPEEDAEEPPPPPTDAFVLELEEEDSDEIGEVAAVGVSR